MQRYLVERTAGVHRLQLGRRAPHKESLRTQRRHRKRQRKEKWQLCWPEMWCKPVWQLQHVQQGRQTSDKTRTPLFILITTKPLAVKRGEFQTGLANKYQRTEGERKQKVWHTESKWKRTTQVWKRIVEQGRHVETENRKCKLSKVSQ